MKIIKIILLLAFGGLLLQFLRGCFEYNRITSVYEYKDVCIYRRDYYGGFEASWIEFSSTDDFEPSWVVEVTARGINGLIIGKFKIKADSIYFYSMAGCMEFLQVNDDNVILEKDRGLSIDLLTSDSWSPPIISNNDSCLIEFQTSLKLAEIRYNEWFNDNPECSDLLRFKILDTSSVFVNRYSLK
ncbi:MAG: hypothetical protein PUD36_09030 [Bacteroidales bacterium]|nr:hypothetical protein [Bacteroidales bacterium]